MTLRIQYRDHCGQPVIAAFSDTSQSVAIGREFPDGSIPDIFLSWDHDVSRGCHVCLYHEDSTWKIKHLSRTRQTRLNGEILPMGVPRELPAVATILAGATELEITHDQEDDIPDGVISERRALADLTPEVSETQRFAALSEVTQVLAAVGEDQLARLLALIRPRFPALHAGGIAIYRDKEILNPAYYPLRGAEISNRLARRALDDRAAFRWDRAASTAAHEYYTSLIGTVQALYTPILRGPNKLGVIWLHTRNEFSDTDLALLKTISEIISANEQFDPNTAHLRMPSVFVSYSHQDKDFVDKLVADIRRQRVTVWVDDRLHGGQDWQEQLAQAIKQSDALALVMSPDSLKSEWVLWEIEQARAVGKPIFPLWSQACDEVPNALDRLQRIDLLADYQAGVLELVEELYGLGETDTLESKPAVTMRAAKKREKNRILFLAANPRDTDSLRLGAEVRTIQDRIRGGKYRDQFDIFQQGWGVRFSDWQQCLLQYKPHIVHFSGHGNTSGELMMEEHVRTIQPVNKKALGLLFGALKGSKTADGVRLVVLNACFSAVQAETLVKEAGCVLGMTRSVSDEAAMAFAGAFYNALTFGESVQIAFNLAEAAMALTGEEETPQLLTYGIDANDLIFCMQENET